MLKSSVVTYNLRCKRDRNRSNLPVRCVSLKLQWENLYFTFTALGGHLPFTFRKNWVSIIIHFPMITSIYRWNIHVYCLTIKPCSHFLFTIQNGWSAFPTALAFASVTSSTQSYLRREQPFTKQLKTTKQIYSQISYRTFLTIFLG